MLWCIRLIGARGVQPSVFGGRLLTALEVDRFAHHENDIKQLARDALKDSIFAAYDIPLLRLPTTGSNEREKIAAALKQAQATFPETSRP